MYSGMERKRRNNSPETPNQPFFNGQNTNILEISTNDYVNMDERKVIYKEVSPSKRTSPSRENKSLLAESNVNDTKNFFLYNYHQDQTTNNGDIRRVESNTNECQQSTNSRPFNGEEGNTLDLQTTTEASNYIDSSLRLSDKQLFHKYSRHFMDHELETLYQVYTAENWFNRARWHIVSLVGFHLCLNLLFFLLKDSEIDQLMDSSIRGQGWLQLLQWLYLLIAFPFGSCPNQWSPFRSRWKYWICLTMVLFNLGFQIWLSCMIRNVRNVFEKKITIQKHFSLCDKKEKVDSLFFVMEVMDFYFTGLMKTWIGFSGVFSFIFVISIRLEFIHITLMTFCAICTYFLIIFIFFVHHQMDYLISTCCYFFAMILICIVSYALDVRNRRCFLIKFQVEKENEKLQNSLQKVQAALLHEPACDTEKHIVKSILETPENKHLEMVRIAFSDLKFLQAIGRGGMGDVIKAKYFGTVVVCKRMRRENISDSTCIKAFKEEIELMSCLRHPNIVQFIGATWDNCSNLCIVMEYLKNGDVHSVLHSNIGRNFYWSDPLLKIAIDVVQGMLYLHSQEPPIVHRDLKSVNILCSATYGCKVGDFGLSRRYNKDIDALTTLVGTPFWLAPEIIRNERYGTEADVYSFGIVLTELETRHTPYYDHPETGLKILMRVANNKLRPTLPASCLKERRQLIEDCLLDDPRKRPTFAEVLARLQGPVRKEIEGDEDRSTLERRALLKKQ
jgi:tRNA A-37 threonylcarbamoyl transferase component Bud32